MRQSGPNTSKYAAWQLQQMIEKTLQAKNKPQNVSALDTNIHVTVIHLK